MIVRMHGIENFVRGIDIDEAKQIAQLVERAGADVINISGFEAPYFDPDEAVYTPETRPEFMRGFPDGCFVPCAAKIKEVVKVPARNTSQKCSNCQKLVPKELSCRIHNCPHCGLSIDRDINVARNILRLGQSLQGAGALAPAMN